MTPWGMNIQPSRTGGFGAFASAQPMVSRRGRARAAPAPRRRVRRLIRLFRIRAPFRLLDPAMRERIAGDDRDDQRLEAVAVLGRRDGEAVDDDFIVAFQLAGQRVGQQSAGEVAAEVVHAIGDDLLQLARAAEADAARQLARWIDRAAALVPVAPAADRVEVLEAEADGIEHL